MCGLATAPIFCPIVAPYLAGMEVTVPLFSHQVHGGPEEIRQAYAAYYQTGLVHFDGEENESGFLSAASFAGRDDLSVTVQGNPQRMLLIARFDNLGKGASGAAIQNLNLLTGAAENAGLVTQA